MAGGAAMQNLNLYQVDKPSGFERPTPRLMALGALLLGALILVDGGWQYWRLRQLRVSSLAAQQAAAQAEAELAQRRQSFHEPQADPQLPLRLAAMEAGNRQLQQLAEHLQLLLRERSGGFRMPLDALAERHLAGLWLSAIRFEQGGSQLRLEGASQSAELLPDYLASLGLSPAFAGRQFARFDLDRDERGVLRFRLASEAADPKEGKR